MHENKSKNLFIFYTKNSVIIIDITRIRVYNITTVKKSNGANRHTVRSLTAESNEAHRQEPQVRPLINNKGDKRNEYKHINSKGQRVKGA